MEMMAFSRNMFMIAGIWASIAIGHAQPVKAAPSQAVKAPANRISVTTRPEIAGLWGMRIPEHPQCIEYYNFKSADQLVIKSAEEWSIGQYQYQPPGSAEDGSTLDAPVLSLNIQYDSNGRDCSGQQIDQSGEVQQLFIKWQNSHQMQFCADDAGQHCYATLDRQLP